MGTTDRLAAEPADVPRGQRRRRRLVQEMAVRTAVALLVLGFHESLPGGPAGGASWLIRALAVLAVALNVPYHLAAQAWPRPRVQAYARMLLDIALITAGLASAGGLAAAPYLGIYAIVPVYAGLGLSSVACLVATGVATVAYLAVATLQQAGGTPAAPAMPSASWPVAVFNLLVLDVVGGLTALLTHASRRHRARLAALNQQLERAHDHALGLNAEIQRGAQLSMLGEVVAGVTHELGNVLTVASGHLGLARRKTTGKEPQIDEHLAQVEQSFDGAMRIIRNTLHTARTSAGRSPIDVPGMAQRILELKGFELERAGVTVRVDFPARFPAVLAAPFQLQQVLLNLIANAQQALHAVTAPRVLEIAGRIGDGEIVVEVRDTGPGISAEALPRLFEPFFTTRQEGTGLGLAIAAGIVHGLGGTLTAENRPGRGALFRLTLPCEAARAAEAAARSGDSAPAR